MARAGAAWRGWFPLGGELTSGAADQKEGVYFGEELGAGTAFGAHLDDGAPEADGGSVRSAEAELGEAEEHFVADEMVAHHAEHVSGDGDTGSG